MLTTNGVTQCAKPVPHPSEDERHIGLCPEHLEQYRSEDAD